MIDKDFIAMEEHICPVCGIKHIYNTGILINKHLKDIPEDKRVTGYGLCEEHQKLFDDDFIALIPVNNDPSGDHHDTLQFTDADRTGEFMHLRKSAFNKIFDSEVSAEQELVFMDKKVYSMLVKAHENAKGKEEETNGT